MVAEGGGETLSVVETVNDGSFDGDALAEALADVIIAKVPTSCAAAKLRNEVDHDPGTPELDDIHENVDVRLPAAGITFGLARRTVHAKDAFLSDQTSAHLALTRGSHDSESGRRSM